MKTGFIYIEIQIIGSAGNFGYGYYSDLKVKSTREDAERYGMRTLGHDDFWVGEIQGNKIVALYSGVGKRTSEKEIKEVNEEFGFNLKQTK